jgi:hypothetical protein
MSIRVVAVVLAIGVGGPPASAQSFEAGVHVPTARWSEFDGNDLGFGGRFTFKPSSVIGIDADLTWYPSDFPGDSVAFTGSRLEGLFGITVGPRLTRSRPFARAAAGFLRASGAPEPFACIAIFPPPLECLMAAGHTMPAVEIGGGVEIDATTRSFVRADVGARMLRYPGPSFQNGLSEIRDDDFWGTALRFTIGAGFRFN